MASESPNRTPNGFVVFLGSAAAFVVVAAVFSAALVTKEPVDEVEQTRATQRIETRTKLDAEAQEKLASVGWIDKAKGTVHVPISDAMTMVLSELSGKKPAPSSVKVEPPLPMPVADPASKEPPPAALPSAPQGADTIRFAPPVAAPAPAPAPEKAAESAPVPAPASPSPASETPAGAPPAAASEAPARPPLINPSENPEPTK